MDQVTEFLWMGGYAPFIWPAYAIVAILLIGLLATSIRFCRLSEAELKKVAPRNRRPNGLQRVDAAGPREIGNRESPAKPGAERPAPRG